LLIAAPELQLLIFHLDRQSALFGRSGETCILIRACNVHSVANATFADLPATHGENLLPQSA
jgi:hypothetical protein